MTSMFDYTKASAKDKEKVQATDRLYHRVHWLRTQRIVRSLTVGQVAARMGVTTADVLTFEDARFGTSVPTEEMFASYEAAIKQ